MTFLVEYKALQNFLSFLDLEIANFIHANNFHIEATKTMIENFYTFRTHLPNLFANRDITGIDMEMTHEVV